MSAAEQRLAEAGFTVHEPVPPVAAYVPAARTGNLVFTAGQLPFVDGALPCTGKVGTEVSPEKANELARICALNALGAVKGLIGDLDQVTRIVKATVFIASDPGFIAQSAVANGASEVLQLAFGESGIHARSAVGMAVLPLDSPVEVEIIVEVTDSP